MNNRIIKFRVWDNLTKKYLDKLYISGQYLNDIFKYNPMIIFKEYVFQQVTGLLDKNGEEIYEGDIVKVQNYKFHIGSHEVELSREFELYPVEWRKCGMWNIARNDISDSSRLYEVVGNIF